MLYSSHIPQTSAIDVPYREWCCGQKVQFRSHHSKLPCSKGFEACLCAVGHIVGEEILCGICTVMTFFWWLDHASWTIFLAVVGLRSTWPWLGFNRAPDFQLVNHSLKHNKLALSIPWIYCCIPFLFYTFLLPFPIDLRPKSPAYVNIWSGSFGCFLFSLWFKNRKHGYFLINKWLYPTTWVKKRVLSCYCMSVSGPVARK